MHMKTIASSEFRRVYAQIKDETVVTVNGHAIGTWIPGAAKMPVVVSAAPQNPILDQVQKQPPVDLPGADLQNFTTATTKVVRPVDRPSEPLVSRPVDTNVIEEIARPFRAFRPVPKPGKKK